MNNIDIERFWKKVDKTSNPNGCWEWIGGLDRDQYGLFSYNKKQYRAHRFMCLINNINIQNQYVCHSCDNPKCVNPNHLWIGNHIQNEIDKDIKGRRPIGINHGRSKLTNQQIFEIRTSLLNGKQLSKKYNVSDAVIYNIKNRKTWKHLP